MKEYTKRRRRADKIRPRVARCVEEMSTCSSFGMSEDGLLNFALLCVIVGEDYDETWKMDTFRDKVEMAKISIVYLLDGHTNAEWVLAILDDAARTWLVSEYPDHTRLVSIEDGLTAWDQYNGVAVFDQEAVEEVAAAQPELSPEQNMLIVLGYAKLAEIMQETAALVEMVADMVAPPITLNLDDVDLDEDFFPSFRGLFGDGSLQ